MGAGRGKTKRILGKTSSLSVIREGIKLRGNAVINGLIMHKGSMEYRLIFFYNEEMDFTRLQLYTKEDANQKMFQAGSGWSVGLNVESVDELVAQANKNIRTRLEQGWNLSDQRPQAYFSVSDVNQSIEKYKNRKEIILNVPDLNTELVF